MTQTPSLNTWTAIEGLLQQESAYGLDINFSHLFAELTGRPETSVLYQVRGLTRRREADISMRGVRNKYVIAMRGACASIWDWYNSATEYRQMSTAAALDMIESHDPACVWAVMLGQTKEVTK